MTTILIVDDEPLIAVALKAALEDAGYTVTTAANGRQGLDRLTQTPPPDLVLLDMMMPVMNGPAMLAAMAGNPALRGIAVIVMSSLDEEAIRSRAQGYTAIVQKPYTLEEITSAIARVLGASAPGHEAGSI